MLGSQNGLVRGVMVAITNIKVSYLSNTLELSSLGYYLPSAMIPEARSTNRCVVPIGA